MRVPVPFLEDTKIGIFKTEDCKIGILKTEDAAASVRILASRSRKIQDHACYSYSYLFYLLVVDIRKETGNVQGFSCV